ncbi:hypothetical protein N5923_23580 [Erwiniaceae bacterium BAC15a-03b]|uniref:Uncharacterized protein n=1 Tax=Winslowiella arboricola TaxID=2978220 RepID=A0A9J6PUY9_9GAMM|nr:hypothetical protein [Winslowiella arboricola]MCU5775068.1 hypothetical protein [Winslowiella arboricola]MCU5780478.1 hypothetical protein [Winslowiella arboricola]
MTEEKRLALIADAKEEITQIQKCLTTYGKGWVAYHESKLERQQIALSALQAEPVALPHPYLYADDKEGYLTRIMAALKAANIPYKVAE